MIEHNEKLRARHKAMALSRRSKARAYDNKDEANLCSSLLNMLDEPEYSLAPLERLNHSLYKPNAVVPIDKYISEDIREFKKSLELASEGRKVLLIGETGSGKGYALDKVLKELGTSIFKVKGKKVIIVLPNASAVEQMGKEYNLPAVHGEGLKLANYMDSDVIVCTWDKLAQSAGDERLKDVIIVRDEAHEINSSDFRKKVVQPLEQLCEENEFITGVLDITATPSRLDFESYDYIVTYDKKNKRAVKVKMYNKICNRTIFDIISNSKKCILLEDDIDHLNTYAKQTDKKAGVICSGNKKNNELHGIIMDTGTLGDFDVLLNTTCMVSSFNLIDEDITDVITVGIKDLQNLKQYPERVRRVEDLTIHIFNDYPKKESYFTYLKGLIENRIKTAQKVVDILNEDIKKEEVEDDEYRCSFGLNEREGFYYSPLKKKYVVDKANIASNVYDDYYKTRNREQLKVLLSEYFSDIEVVDIEVEDDKKEVIDAFKKGVLDEAQANLKRSESFKDILVGSSSIVFGETITDNHRFYLKANDYNVDDLRKTYKLLNIDKMLENNHYRNIIDKFTDYVIKENYDLEYAWGLAQLKDLEVKKLDLMIKSLKHRLKEEQNGSKMSRANKLYLENKQFKFISDEVNVGVAFAKEHFTILTEKFNKKFKTRIKEKELKDYIKATYKLKRTQVTTEATNFYNNKSPKTKTKGNKVNVEVVAQLLTINDIAEVLNVNPDNKTLSKLLTV